MVSKIFSRLSRTTVKRAAQALAHGVTLPYYRFYRQNTLLPIQAVAASINNGEGSEVISEKLKRWRDRKLHEFQFVQVAATLLAAAVIGCFSWPPRDEQQHWLGPAAWYCSLVLSISAVLLSSSEAFIFAAIKNAAPTSVTGEMVEETPVVMSPRLLQELSMIVHVKNWDGSKISAGTSTDDNTAALPGAVPIIRTTTTATRISGEQSLDRQPRGDQNNGNHDPEATHRHHRPGVAHGPEQELIKADIRWNMVFTWQAPIMLMAYSVVGFFIGLVIYVCTPLYDGHQGPYLNGPGKGAILFIVWSTVSGAVFVWCSFWAYRFVDLDDL